LKLLDVKHAVAYDALYANLKGDILIAQGNRAEARAAYQSALDKSEARGTFRQLVQVKLDALGETVK
jgi:predicted negative regulator of RcsB-dependent stress response